MPLTVMLVVPMLEADTLAFMDDIEAAVGIFVVNANVPAVEDSVQLRVAASYVSCEVVLNSVMLPAVSFCWMLVNKFASLVAASVPAMVEVPALVVSVMV